jgi:4-diphosphocytidyl-2-C-methyl-D-erythritol kinase
MLRALRRLFPEALDPEREAALAAELGSDVPFFLGRSTLARGRGRGERLEPLNPLPPLSGLVVMPAVHVSTARAYAALDRRRTAGGAGDPMRTAALDSPYAGVAWSPPRSWGDVVAGAVNDFEDVVAAEVDVVERVRAALRDTAPVLALLTGSGAASFALYGREEAAVQAASRIRSASLPVRVYRVRTLDRWPDPTAGPASAEA